MFATSGSSDFGHTVEELEDSCPGASISAGKVWHGVPSVDELKTWTETMKV